MRWVAVGLLFILPVIPMLSSAHAPPDTSNSSNLLPGANAIVTLTDGRTYQATGVRLLKGIQMVEVELAGGGAKHFSDNRIRSISGVDGRDLTHRVLVDGIEIGPKEATSEPEPLPEARLGTLELGSDLTFALSTYAGGQGIFLQVPVRLGVFLSSWFELEPSAALTFAGLPVMEVQVSEVLHGSGAPRDDHLYARIIEGAYIVTPGKPPATTLGVGLGLDLPGRGRTSLRMEVGYSHIYEAPDIGANDIISFGLGSSVRLW